ncbi:trypsin-like peptidase domain-containing protein, partial [Amycolatopsis sp. CM201R]|uniref:trypsin-like peptidase domain-containing protein n=1 Tax=Amycolatopsis sp. CM201R TaxID=2761537 RepID=UPI0028741043
MNSDPVLPSRSWVVAVHLTLEDLGPAGTGVVLDERRVLTSAHVIPASEHGRAGLCVAFPFAESEAMLNRVRVREVRRAAAPQADMAVLHLDSPIPAGVAVARLRCPPADALKGLRWEAVGFPGGQWQGSVAHGEFGPGLGYGWVRLDTQSRYPIDQGFSGGGLWCPDYESVVAMVGTAEAGGDGQGLTLFHADRFAPEEQIQVLTEWSIRASDEAAQQAWGWHWSLGRDREADRHWRPRARGVMSAAEQGNRFRGRVQALREIVNWLTGPDHDPAILIVTGRPGAGKSAVLGRIVVTAAGDIEDGEPGASEDGQVLAPKGSVDCAVHVKSKTALEVAREIARAASAPLPQEPADLPALLATATADRTDRFALVVDALDEADDPEQARAIIRDVLLPITAGHGPAQTKILVGTRRFVGEEDLLQLFGSRVPVIDLDEPNYFELDDLAACAQATLQLRGAERPGNPYQSDAVAVPVARRIAALAERNFLVASLVARTHGLYDEYPIPVEQIRFTPDVREALAGFLQHLPAVDGLSAEDLLAALAYIDAPGVPVGVWRAALQALLGRAPDERQMREFAQTSAANFLVESSRSYDPVYRLFHQALNETLAKRPSSAADEAAIARAFIDYGRQRGWRAAPRYLRQSLPAHAARAGVIDELLTDVDYTLHADLRRLIPATAAGTSTSRAQQAVSLLHRTPAAIDADPAHRLALFSVTEALDELDLGYRQHVGAAPYRGIWAHVRPRTERSILTGHTASVHGVCAVRVDGRDLLASASDDETVRIWDPTTGTEVHRLTGHTGWVTGVCA